MNKIIPVIIAIIGVASVLTYIPSQPPQTITITVDDVQLFNSTQYIPQSKICPEDTDWPEAPNRCDRRADYTRTELKELYDEYYQYKGAEWMEMKKTEMDSVIASGFWSGDSGQLWYWLGHTQHETPFENKNVYLYYLLQGQAPNTGWGYYTVDDEMEPIITWYYASKSASLIISLIVIIGTVPVMILSFKKSGLHQKRKIFAMIGFALVFVGLTMYSVTLYEIIQRQLNQTGELLILYTISFFLAIQIAVMGIPFILYGFIQRFSLKTTLLTLLGLIILWIMYILSRLD